MKKIITLAMIAFFGIMISGVDHADAKRFGMGSSFGKQRMSQPKANSFSQRQAAPQKSAAANQRGSSRGGMMGMLGGLALGGLLGAMFFGGAFDGINMFDIFIIGAIIAVAFFFLRRRASSAMQQHHAYAGGSPLAGSRAPSEPLFSGSSSSDEESSAAPTGNALRPDIDEESFLPAAKSIYVRMQAAWDNKDIEDIRKFCAPEIADRIAQDMAKDQGTHRTEVATLQAEIQDGWIESDLEWVAVNYSAMLREQTLDQTGNTVDDNSTEVNEVWIFQHPQNSDDPTWYLAGIQQQS